MREYVVKVSSPGSRGTGFVIGRGLVATALHVVAERLPDGIALRGEPCRLEFARLNVQSGTWEQRETVARMPPGAWDLDDDWALLEFDPAGLEGWKLPSAGLARVREEAVVGRRLLWSSWGFPDAHPRLGMETGGHIRTITASLDAVKPGRNPVTAIQLYSEEAAAASGMPVKGLSGAPVLVEGNVVGLLRYSLLQPGEAGQERRNQAGTLYATPIERLRDPGGLFRWEDSDRLPPIGSSERLPEEPFRFLERYERRDYRVFFGRGSDIRQFLSDLRRADLPPVGLLFGPMGAGKSSFLRAGIEARLTSRRLHVEPRGIEGLLAAWWHLREKVGETEDLPVLDQIEEAWTAGKGDGEFAELLVQLANWIEARGSRPGVQLFLSFREDRLSSVEDELRRHGMRWHPFPLRHLDSPGLLETMTGFELDPAVRDHYRIAFHPDDLPQTIVDAVLTGNPGAVAPVLQVLLARLWARARSRAEADADSKRTICLADFELEQAAAEGLRDFLEKQLLAADANCPKSLQSGLALEILSEYTTPGGTATSRRTEELTARYSAEAQVPIPLLVNELAIAKLLFRDHPGSHRLVHDSLAAVVQHAVAESDRPAQRARRTLENRAVDWINGRVGQPLDDADLAIVEAGKGAMRAQTPSEQRLLEVSREQRIRRATMRKVLWAATTLAVAAVMVAGLWALVASRRSAEARHAAAQRLAANWFLIGNSAFENEDDVLTSLLAVSQAISTAPTDDPGRPSYFARLLALAPAAPQFVMNLGATSRASIDANHHVVVLQRNEGAIESWDIFARRRLPPILPVITIPGGLLYSDPPAIREDGKYAGIVTPTTSRADGLRMLVWELSTGHVILDETVDTIFSPAFGPAGWVAQGPLRVGRDRFGGMQLWRIQPPSTLRPLNLPTAVSIAPSSASDALVASIDGGLRLVDPSTPTVAAGPFLSLSSVAWTGWMYDGRLLAIGRQGAGFQGYVCGYAGCEVWSSASLTEDPSATGLRVDPCGGVFGQHFFLDASGLETRLPTWPRLGRLCQAGNTLLGVSEGYHGQWRTYLSILECEMERGQCYPRERANHRIPGGAIAVDWTSDRRRLLTLSAGGTLLAWPMLGGTPVPTPMAPTPREADVLETWPAFSPGGGYVAVGAADHAGVDIVIRSLPSGRSVSARVEFPEDTSLPASLRGDSHFIRGQLRVVRFGDDGKRLLVGVQGRVAELSVIDSADGSVLRLPYTPPGNLEDATLLGTSVVVVLASRVVEQVALDGSGKVGRCKLPASVVLRGFGRHGELLLHHSDGIEVWSAASCKTIASIATTGGERGIDDLALALLRQADGITSDGHGTYARFGQNEITIGPDEEGTLAALSGGTHLRVPRSTDDHGWYRVVSVAPNSRRAILVYEQSDEAPEVGVWDLENGLPIGSPAPATVDGKSWSTGLSSHSNFGASFNSGGDRLRLVSRSEGLMDVQIGPTQLVDASWMKDIDVGLTGLRLRDDGGFYSPPKAAERMRAFRLQLEDARSRGDLAAGALLEALASRK